MADTAPSAESIAHDITAAALEKAKASELGAGFGSPASAAPTPSKQLDFDLGIQLKDSAMTPATPAAPPAPIAAPTSAPADADAVDYTGFVRDVLLWTNVVRSVLYLLGGVCGILLIDWLVNHDVPLITVLCYATLAQMAINWVRYMVNPSLQQKATWLDSAWTYAAITSVSNSLKTLAAVHDTHLNAASAHKHLIIAVSLWLTSLACTLISPTHLALALYVGAFVVPKLYVMNRKAIDPKAKELFDQVKPKFEALDNRIKAAVVIVGILLLGLVSTANLVIAVFVIGLFVSSQMPKEFEDMTKRAAPVLTPIGNTAAAMGGHISKAVGGVVQKYELTPTPAKKKRQ